MIISCKRLSIAVSTAMVTGWLLSGCGESATELYSQAQTAEKNGLSQVEVAALYQKAADAGSSDAWLYLSTYYRKTKDYQHAVNSYLNIKEQYPAIYAYNMGTMYLNGEGVPANEEKGIELLEQADGLGEHLAMYEAGNYFWAKGDFNRAAFYLKKSASHNDYRAFYKLASLYLQKKIPGDHSQEALALLKNVTEANKATPEERLLLARCYIDGTGGEQSLLKADYVLRKIENDRKYKDQVRVLHAEIDLNSPDQNTRTKALNDLRTMVNEKADAQAALFLYKVYRYGRYGVTKSAKEALHYIRIAERGNLALADLALASLYYDGIGIEQNFNESSRYITKAYEIEPDNPEVLYWYGRMFAEGIGVKRDDVQGFHYLSLAAKLGHVDADYLRAVMINSGRALSGSEEDAVQMFKKHADEGNAEAAFRYGLALFDGYVVERNLENAVKYLKQAVSGGIENAIFPLASASQESGDIENATTWYLRATKLPEPESRQAWARLGEIHYAQKKLDESYRAYKSAYEAGHVKAGINLARLLYVAERYTEALPIFEKYKDNALSQVFLGLMYQYGRGVEQSDVKALEWYDRAIEQKNTDAMFLEAVLIREGHDIPETYNGTDRTLLVNASCLNNEEAILYLATRLYRNSAQDAVGWLEYAKKYNGSSRADALLNREFNEVPPEEHPMLLKKVKDSCQH